MELRIPLYNGALGFGEMLGKLLTRALFQESQGIFSNLHPIYSEEGGIHFPFTKREVHPGPDGLLPRGAQE